MFEIISQLSYMKKKIINIAGIFFLTGGLMLVYFLKETWL